MNAQISAPYGRVRNMISAADGVRFLLGWRVYPFDPLIFDAVEDRSLAKYLVPDDNLALVLSGYPAIIWGSPGSGKSALRVGAARSAWLGQGALHAYPVSYIFSEHFNPNTRAPDLTQHLRAMEVSLARNLILILAYRPHFFIGLSLQNQRSLASFIGGNLGKPLTRFLIDALRQDGAPDGIVPVLHQGYFLGGEPPASQIRQFANRFDDVLTSIALTADGPALANPIHWLHLIREVLGARSLVFLVDGVDAFPDTGRQPHVAADWLLPLLDQAAGWSALGIHLQAFVPSDVFECLQASSRLPDSPFRCGQMTWTSESLVNLLSRRIRVASGNAYSSLQAVADPGLVDIEEEIADRVIAPLPREALALTHAVLQRFCRRWQAILDVSRDSAAAYVLPTLSREDLEMGIEDYRVSMPVRKQL